MLGNSSDLILCVPEGLVIHYVFRPIFHLHIGHIFIQIFKILIVQSIHITDRMAIGPVTLGALGREQPVNGDIVCGCGY
jgi:hypothetical protein